MCSNIVHQLMRRLVYVLSKQGTLLYIIFLWSKPNIGDMQTDLVIVKFWVAPYPNPNLHILPMKEGRL